MDKNLNYISGDLKQTAFLFGPVTYNWYKILIVFMTCSSAPIYENFRTFLLPLFLPSLNVNDI